MTQKQLKRLERLIKSIDKMLNQMDHTDMRPLVEAWNGDRNIRKNLADFADWQSAKLKSREVA